MKYVFRYKSKRSKLCFGSLVDKSNDKKKSERGRDIGKFERGQKRMERERDITIRRETERERGKRRR